MGVSLVVGRARPATRIEMQGYRMMRRRSLRAVVPLLRQVGSLAAPYWRSEERWQASGLLAAIIALTLGMVYLLVLLTDWNRSFYNALEDKDFGAFQQLLLQFCGLVIVYIIGAVAKLYLTQLMEINWRTWMTQRYLKKWLDNRAYYRLELQGRETTDNPDQRIADDLRMFTSGALGLSLGLFSSVVTLISFIAVLWAISPPLSFTIGDTPVTIQGYMVWVAILYAVVGTFLAHKVGHRLTGLNFQQERYEADFRFSLVRLRENAEGVALYRGEEFERQNLLSRFSQIRSNYKALMLNNVRLSTFTVGYNQIANIFPILVAAPQYFSGAIPLGGLMQISSAFGRVQDALSWFVNSYDSIANWSASVKRLAAFRDALDRASAAPTDPRRLSLTPHDRPGLSVEAVEVALPNGQVLLANLSLDVSRGDRVLLQGPSGCGKSTLFRAIAGIWPFGAGQIQVPADASVLFLPQKPYLPIASLREVVAYPEATATYNDYAIREALVATGLTQLVDRLDETQNWSMQLSGGEQQRLAFARALLHQPDWLFLDEATSALDPAAEDDLHELLRRRLPATTVVSIAHRDDVAWRYDHTIVVAAGREERALVTA
jgi:putative ATP-binding cassette transporter